MEGLGFAPFIIGISTGALYAAVAIGLSLIYGILNIGQFGHGSLYMLGGYIGLAVLSAFGATSSNSPNLQVFYWVSFVVAIIAVMIISLPIERFVFRPLYNAPHVNGFLAALGLVYIIDNATLKIWGGDSKSYPSPYTESVDILGMSLSGQRIVMLIVCVILILVVSYFMYRTTLGRTIRAAAQSREGVALCGISFNRVSMLTFAIAGGLAAAAGVLIAPTILLAPGMGMLPTVKAFVIVILGGMGSVPGAALGGFLLGLVESYGAAYIYQDFFAFGILVLVLAIRPTGLFGVRQ